MLNIQNMSLDDFYRIENKLQEEFDRFWTPGVFLSELKKDDTRYVVLKEDEDIVGFAGIWITPDNIELNNIVVRKDRRGKGYSKLLLEKLLEISKEYDKENILLEVSEVNEVAISLYEKYGFIKNGQRKKYYEGKYDAILMIKKL